MPDVTVVGGGVAGLSAACALAEAGLRVEVLERRPYLGGRASSFRHPGAGEAIDNCQHVVFGCCTNVLAFYRRIGAERHIRWSDTITMVEPGGRRTVLGGGRLWAPLHGLPRLLAAAAFAWADKLAIGRAMAALMRGVPADSTETLAAWLARQGQTPRAVERFWRLVIASALNADLDHISLPYAAMVIRELFLKSPEAGRMGVSTVPLGELYASAVEYLAARGGAVRLNRAFEGAQWDASTNLILALPFEALGKLLPHLPPGGEALQAQIRRHEHWPILSLHLWYDREITDLDHAVLLDGDFHWMYHKSRFQPARDPRRSYLELVVSAARALAAVPGDELAARAARDLGGYFPAAKDAVLVKSAVIKEHHATFGVPPGIDAARPGPESPWPHCFLAGDWTRTGWPSTMESAARSGHLAAEAVLRQRGRPRKFLAPDLPARGLLIFGGGR